MRPVRKAVLPVAGMGTRFLPATKAMPKEMLTVVDRPVIQHAVQEALSSGIEQLIFVTGRGKTAIEDHFDHAFELEATLAARGKKDALQTVEATNFPPGTIAYVRQQEPLGLGHAVWCGKRAEGGCNCSRTKSGVPLTTADWMVWWKPNGAPLFRVSLRCGTAPGWMPGSLT